MQKLSKTNWKRIDSIKDNEIDCSDIPEIDEKIDNISQPLPIVHSWSCLVFRG
ncbi:MAG: hypothetical protein WCO53_04630 [Deltaproteobacteria bacterium]